MVPPGDGGTAQTHMHTPHTRVDRHTPWPGPQELMETVHLHLVKEYITRLCKRRLVLKTAEQQQQLAKHVLANAELIHGFCTQNVSPPR